MRSLPNILKYFMKPKAEDYTLPDTEQMAAQLEEMVRFQESIPQENCYLTSYGYLSFCRVSNSTRSACKFPSCVQLVLLRS